MKLNQEQQKIFARYLEARKAWAQKWVELYENDYKNATVTDRAIQSSPEDYELQISKLEWDLDRVRLYDIPAVKTL